MPRQTLARSLRWTQASRKYHAGRTRRAGMASAVLHRTLSSDPLHLVSASGTRLRFSNGHEIIDTSCGAGVACIGYNDKRVKQAMVDQIDNFSYANSVFFSHSAGEQLATDLIQGTDGHMSKAYIMSSGSEAMESAMKMARQYFMELNPKQDKRVNFISRDYSYHGTTLGSLSMSGHAGRRKLFEGMLLPNIYKVSPCNAYRFQKPGQTTEEYVAQLADELDHKFQDLGPESVIAFVAEPTVGATTGCVPSVPGYFKAMKQVCDRYGALLILDEVMSGMGRSGTLHAWEQEGVVPHIQTIAKALGGGYAPIAGMLIDHEVAGALESGSGSFSHGHTYQGHPLACAAALEVQRIIREERLVDNVREQGVLLGELLHEYLDDHPRVGNIEFVQNKETKEPFPVSAGVANAIHTIGLEDIGISLYPGTGTVDGTLGDHVLLAPAYNSTPEEITMMAKKVQETVYRTFERLAV
ncbi:Adenosylmethionine-8-amino-7-oxononanoate aminotransferase [Geosmithia morbida]|uniref:Adenosylmethionine-8-amino-7-oxononanoate aminotransferase n=1 Tax=Geosmithia morbida TaxID=1094350 RepID=A0A9P4YZ89_9HYPO|nr:Adenosylmethionine-8-amino-7-oxononanoate aminotransferase [Geosmithia morbida]KAF4124509.1 Adenosylmethionine-8-amino-7-oxononanoate aminotransferase [Geosmithia morbida]